MSDDETCSSCSLAWNEDVGGTASRYRLWLLIEQPGAWGPDALKESQLPDDVATEIDARRRAAGVRVLLTRRGPGAPPTERRRWSFVRADAQDPQIGGGTFADPAELLDLDLAGMANGGTPLPRTYAEPLLAVCTHGRHDRCCADNGRPVARALRAAGLDAWECSHVGGDRFAANLVSFPHGLFHGRVTPESALSVAQAYAAGRIHAEGYRGRAAWPPPVQQAEIFLRRVLDDWAIDSLRLRSHDSAGPLHTVTFIAPGGSEHVVVVEVGVDPTARPLTCRDPEPRHPRTITEVSVRPA